MRVACPAHLIIDFVALVTINEEYK